MRFETIGDLLRKARSELKWAQSMGSANVCVLINHEYTDRGPQWGLALNGTFMSDGEEMCFMGPHSVFMISSRDLSESLDVAPDQRKAKAFREMLRDFSTQASFARDFETFDIDGLG